MNMIQGEFKYFSDWLLNRQKREKKKSVKTNENIGHDGSAARVPTHTPVALCQQTPTVV